MSVIASPLSKNPYLEEQEIYNVVERFFSLFYQILVAKFYSSSAEVTKMFSKSLYIETLKM